MKEIVIRKIRELEIEKLNDMLYEAIYQPNEQTPIPRSVLGIPEVYAYIKDFGKLKDDYCLVAESYGEIVGAVWFGYYQVTPGGMDMLMTILRNLPFLFSKSIVIKALELS